MILLFKTLLHSTHFHHHAIFHRQHAAIHLHHVTILHLFAIFFIMTVPSITTFVSASYYRPTPSSSGHLSSWHKPSSSCYHPCVHHYAICHLHWFAIAHHDGAVFMTFEPFLIEFLSCLTAKIASKFQTKIMIPVPIVRALDLAIAIYSFSIFMVSRMNAGRSEGSRKGTRLSSITTSLSS